MNATTYADWCKANDCTHGHCPLQCAKPQPFALDGRLVCGRCAVLDGVVSEMLPCVPELCETEGEAP